MVGAKVPRRMASPTGRRVCATIRRCNLKVDMTRFIDGPAEGVTLMLKRTPVYLRVVRNRQGKWDALDQLDDSPASDEEIFVYRLKEHLGNAFVDGPKIKGCYAMVNYEAVPGNYSQDDLRNDWPGLVQKIHGAG